MPLLIQQDPGIARRRKLAESMLARGKTGPVRTGMEGAGRLAQTMANVYGVYKADKDQKEYMKAGNEDLARIISDYGNDVRPEALTPQGAPAAAQIQMMQMQQDRASEAAAAARQHGLEDYEAKKLIDQRYPKPASEFDQYIKSLQGDKLKLANIEKEQKLKLSEKAGSEEKHSIQTAYDMAAKLRDSKGFGSIYGSFQGATPNIRQSSVDAGAVRDQLGNILTLAARGALKGQGQVSDSETRMLQQAQTMLNNPRISDEMAVEEVGRVMAYLESKGAIAPSAPTTSTRKAGRRSNKQNSTMPTQGDIEAEIQRRQQAQ